MQIFLPHSILNGVIKKVNKSKSCQTQKQLFSFECKTTFIQLEPYWDKMPLVLSISLHKKLTVRSQLDSTVYFDFRSSLDFSGYKSDIFICAIQLRSFDKVKQKRESPK